MRLIRDGQGKIAHVKQDLYLIYRKPLYPDQTPRIFYSGITKFDCTSKGSESPKGQDGLFGIMLIGTLHEYI